MIPAPSRDGATAGGDDADFLQRCARELRRYETVGDEARLFKIAIDARTALAAKDAEIARLTRERDEMRERGGQVTELRAALRGLAVYMEWDCPGDVPEPCGMWCAVCGQHVNDDTQTGHADGCLCAEPNTLAASPAQQDAAADGMPARHDMREVR